MPPPAPAAGSDRYAADRASFKATRALEGTRRSALAENYAQLGVPDLESDFSCVLGVKMTPEKVPKLTLLLTRVARDAGRVSNHAKDIFKHDRPFKIGGGAICTPHDSVVDNSYASPLWPHHGELGGWLILAELAPDRATKILTRARAYGESRVVCGVHNASAVESGRTAGAIAAAAVNGLAEFRAALA